MNFDAVSEKGNEDKLAALRQAQEKLDELGIGWVELRRVLIEMPPVTCDQNAPLGRRYHATRNANALFALFEDKKMKVSQRRFVTGVRADWLSRGFLTYKQAKVICEIAEEIGAVCSDFHSYIGYATEEWLEECLLADSCGQPES